MMPHGLANMRSLSRKNARVLQQAEADGAIQDDVVCGVHVDAGLIL